MLGGARRVGGLTSAFTVGPRERVLERLALRETSTSLLAVGDSLRGVVLTWQPSTSEHGAEPSRQPGPSGTCYARGAPWDAEAPGNRRPRRCAITRAARARLRCFRSHPQTIGLIGCRFPPSRESNGWALVFATDCSWRARLTFPDFLPVDRTAANARRSSAFCAFPGAEQAGISVAKLTRPRTLPRKTGENVQ
jgi:hypothetical protein